jgi:hypothetical protein
VCGTDVGQADWLFCCALNYASHRLVGEVFLFAVQRDPRSGTCVADLARDWKLYRRFRVHHVLPNESKVFSLFAFTFIHIFF